MVIYESMVLGWIYLHNWVIYVVSVGKYTIHVSSGIDDYLVGGDWNMTGLFSHSVGNLMISID